MFSILTVPPARIVSSACLWYTSDSADDSLRVDLCGRRIINKKNKDFSGYEVAGYIMLHGYISTSLKRDEAEKFAWENADSGHQRVLFHIKWDNSREYYYMNAGAFDHEEEILLLDGAECIVESVEPDTD